MFTVFIEKGAAIWPSVEKELVWKVPDGICQELRPFMRPRPWGWHCSSFWCMLILPRWILQGLTWKLVLLTFLQTWQSLKCPAGASLTNGMRFPGPDLLKPMEPDFFMKQNT